MFSFFQVSSWLFHLVLLLQAYYGEIPSLPNLVVTTPIPLLLPPPKFQLKSNFWVSLCVCVCVFAGERGPDSNDVAPGIVVVSLVICYSPLNWPVAVGDRKILRWC